MSQARQPLNVYFVMLIASAIFMLLACILMFVEFYRYGAPWESTGVRAMGEPQGGISIVKDVRTFS